MRKSEVQDMQNNSIVFGKQRVTAQENKEGTRYV
jgi:hypothetical protein